MEQVTRKGVQTWTIGQRIVRLAQRCSKAAGLIALVVGLPFSFVARAADQPLEYQVKAAFLLNFTKFIAWPNSAFADQNSPMTICVLGDDPFGNTLDQVVAGEVVNGRRVAVERIKTFPEPKACQVLFTSKPDKDVTQGIAELKAGVLTVGEGSSFTQNGGIIAFVIDNRRVRFSINRANAESAGLKLSSKLLSVAISVEQ